MQRFLSPLRAQSGAPGVADGGQGVWRVPAEAIEALLGRIGRALPIGAAATSRNLRSPGMMLSHYAPGLPVRLGATQVGPAEALLAFGAPLPGAAITWTLSDTGDLAEDPVVRQRLGPVGIDFEAGGVDGAQRGACAHHQHGSQQAQVPRNALSQLHGNLRDRV
jgi:hypothetical protein